MLRPAQVAGSQFYAGEVLIHLEGTTSLSVEAENAVQQPGGKVKALNTEHENAADYLRPDQLSLRG
jgi:hypothetical protein